MTLSEINITPLLDLAFVLLIIFVITTPLLEQGFNLNLAQGGAPDEPIRQEDIRTVDIAPQGVFVVANRRLTAAQVEMVLARDARANPNLVAYIRPDERASWKDVAAVMETCRRNGIRISARTEPPGTR